MPSERPDADEVVRRLGGVASRRQILRQSTQHSLRRAVTMGVLNRIAPDTYALPETALAYCAAAASRGLVSHTSAAEHWRLERLNPDPSASPAHITVPRHGRFHPMRSVKVHFNDVAAVDDHNGVTSPLRTVLDCAALLPFAEALAIADSALRRDLVTSEALVEGARRRRGPGGRRVRLVAAAADIRAANPLESGLRAIVIEAGFQSFEPQLPVRTSFMTAWVDLGDPELRLALEADSYAFHGSRDALLRDCHRYDELVRSGWLVLRFGYEHVMFERDWVSSVIADTYELRSRDRRQRRLNKAKDSESARIRID
jgi:very-short-patch-repair endonuclease